MIKLEPREIHDFKGVKCPICKQHRHSLVRFHPKIGKIIDICVSCKKRIYNG